MLSMLTALWVTLLACGPEPADPSPPPTPPTPLETVVDGGEEAASDEVAPPRVAIRHILVAYAGAKRAPLGTNRSRKEAQKQASALRSRITAGETMAELAKRYSDDGSKARGGFLGSSEAGSWVPEFEAAAFALKVGQVSGIVETAFGFHLLQREPLLEVRLQHMIMQYDGAANLSGRAKEEKRTKDAAFASAEQALVALESGQDFEAVAREYSDGPMGRRGPDLGWFTRGEIGPAFDEPVFALESGETSRIIESPFGFHIVKRVE